MKVNGIKEISRLEYIEAYKDLEKFCVSNLDPLVIGEFGEPSCPSISDLDVFICLKKENFKEIDEEDVSVESKNIQIYTEKQQDLQKLLEEEYCVGKSIAEDLIKKYSIEQIEGNLVYVKHVLSQGDIKNLGGYTKYVIENNLKNIKPKSEQIVEKKKIDKK